MAMTMSISTSVKPRGAGSVSDRIPIVDSFVLDLSFIPPLVSDVIAQGELRASPLRASGGLCSPGVYAWDLDANTRFVEPRSRGLMNGFSPSRGGRSFRFCLSQA